MSYAGTSHGGTVAAIGGGAGAGAGGAGGGAGAGGARGVARGGVRGAAAMRKAEAAAPMAGWLVEAGTSRPPLYMVELVSPELF